MRELILTDKERDILQVTKVSYTRNSLYLQTECRGVYVDKENAKKLRDYLNEFLEEKNKEDDDSIFQKNTAEFQKYMAEKLKNAAHTQDHIIIADQLGVYFKAMMIFQERLDKNESQYEEDKENCRACHKMKTDVLIDHSEKLKEVNDRLKELEKFRKRITSLSNTVIVIEE